MGMGPDMTTEATDSDITGQGGRKEGWEKGQNHAASVEVIVPGG